MNRDEGSDLHQRAHRSAGQSPEAPDHLAQLFEAAIDTIDDLFVVLDSNEEFVVWNDRATAVTGYSDDEFASMAPSELFVSDEYARLAEAVANTRTDGTAFVQADLRTKDGEVVPKEFTLSRLDYDEDCAGVVAIGRNLTRANRHQRRYHRLLDRISDGFYALDSEWRLTYLNEQAHAAFPETDEDVVGQVIWEAFPETVGTECEDHLRTAAEEQTPQNYETYNELQESWYDIHIYPDRDGVSVMFSDVTECHQHREELDRANELLHTLLDGLPVGVLAEDADRRVVTVNEQFLQLFDIDRDPETIIGADCAAFAEKIKGMFADPNSFVEGIDTRIDAEEDVADERLELVDERIFERSYLPVDFPDRDGHLWVYRETTERHEYEQTLERQNERLDEFVSVVSHDLRNPLVLAQGRLALAREECECEHLDSVETAHKRIEHLIEDLLVLARQGQSIGDRERIELAAVARSSVKTVGIDSDQLVLDTERTVSADRSRLRQLLENLFRNSIEHGGADVTITVGDFEDGFYVADDGPGIPPEDRRRVFDSGYSTTTEGTGYGLSIVHDVAEAHGWGVAVTERDDGGARFEFTMD